MRYWPSPSVVIVLVFSMSASLVASTVTPGSTAARGVSDDARERTLGVCYRRECQKAAHQPDSHPLCTCFSFRSLLPNAGCLKAA